MLMSLPINGEIAICNRCHLSAGKGLGIGNPCAQLLLVAQNPGRIRPWNLQRIPFELQYWGEGRTTHSSKVFEDTLTAVGLSPKDFYITNIQKCEGSVQADYLETCGDWLEQELLALRGLKLIVAVGSIAAVRLGAPRSFKVGVYTSKVDTCMQWRVTSVAHPAAPLYPAGISRKHYRQQWEFVVKTLRES